MNYVADKIFIKGQKTAFIPSKDGFMILLLAIIGSYLNYIPYSNTASIILQTLLLGMIFLLYRKRPVMMIVAIILLSILPARMYGGFNDTAQSFYTLNAKICILFSLIFIIYGMVILKRNYRIKIPTVLFVTIMICSLAWTVSLTSYTGDFWWMCAAYIFLPMFIKVDNDIRVVLIAYVIAVDIFCINILRILVSDINLYRGVINLNPNYAAFFILTGIAIIVTMLTQYKVVLSEKFKIFLLSSIVLSIITMANFASRTSFILLVFLIIMYLLFNFKRVKTIIIFLIGSIVFYLTLNHYGIFDTVLIRFGDANTTTAGGRLIIQQELLNSFCNSNIFNFLFGNGYLTANNFGLGMQAHNTYISILIGFGMVGFIIYFAYLFKIFFSLNKSIYKPFLIIFCFLCIYGFALEPYHIIEGIIFFCLLSGINNIKSSSPLIHKKGRR